MISLTRLQKRLGIAFLFSFSLFVVATSVYAQGNGPEVAVLPATLERISWGGIIAGTIIAIVVQLAGNLLAIGVGVGRLNPNPNYDEHPDTVATISSNTLVMMGVTILLALFLGGYVAARFSGSADQGDALLHGLMVWGLDTVITLFLLTTTLGTIFSGFSSLLGHGVRLIGSATSLVAQGAASVVQGAANVAGSVTSAVGDMAQDAAGKAKDAAENLIESNPDLQRLSHERDTLMQRIQDEAMRLVNQAGINPDTVKDQAQDALQDAKQTVQNAAQQIQESPTELQRIVVNTLNQLFQRGERAAGQVGNQMNLVDRENLIHLMVERGNMSYEQAEQQISNWEMEYNDLRSRGEQMLKQVREQAEELKAEAQLKIEQAKREAEQKAREVAEATTKAVSRFAMAAFAAIVVGAIAAGIGGIAGTQKTIPTAEIAGSNTVVITPAGVVTPPVVNTTAP